MTPDQIVMNAIALVQSLLVPGGSLAAVVGTVAYGYGKAADSPNIVRWGKQAWVGGLCLFGGTAIISLVQYVASRIFA